MSATPPRPPTSTPMIRGGWELLGDTEIESFRIMRARKSKRRNLRNGAEFDFFLIDGHDWANVLAITPDNQVVLVKQYRHGAEEYTFEIPGGCVEPGEDPHQGAVRELREETGYSVTESIPLGVVRPNPALMSNFCYFYLARGASLTHPPHLDPGEDINVVLKPVEEVIQMATNGQLGHGLHVAALGIARIRGLI